MRSRALTILLLGCIAFAGLEGQDFVDAFMGVAVEVDSVSASSPETFDLMPVFNPWLLSTNPAGHHFDPEIYPGRLDLNHKSETGDYKRVQQGDTLRLYSFQTERYKRIKRTVFYGNFAYDKSYERNVHFTDVNDPFRETPYMLVDTMNYGDIVDREFFTLRGDLSTPLFWKLCWGLSADMDVGLASQNRDPRPRNKVLDLAMSSGFLVDLSAVKIGVNGLYSYYNEDIEVDVIQQNEQVTFLQVHGFDSYTYHVAASYNRLYKRSAYGGEGQLNLKLGPVNSLFGGKFLYIMETADDGRKGGDASWSYMKGDSELEGNELRLFNATTLRMDHSLHALHAVYQERYMVGAELIQRLENVGEAGAVDWVDYGKEEKYASNIFNLDLDYAYYWMKDAHRKSYEFRLGANYLGSEQAYYLPDQHMRYMNRILSVAFGKSLYFGRQECALGIKWMRKKNMEAERRFNQGNFVSDNILFYDFNFLTSDYKAYTLDISYAVALHSLFEKYFVSASISRYQSRYTNSVVAGKSWTNFNFSTGVIF